MTEVRVLFIRGEIFLWNLFFGVLADYLFSNKQLKRVELLTCGKTKLTKHGSQYNFITSTWLLSYQ